MRDALLERTMDLANRNELIGDIFGTVTYADDTAAATGGVAIGEFYVTDAGAFKKRLA